MKSDELRQVVRALDDVEDSIRRIRRDMDVLGHSIERLVASCDDEVELLDIINRDRRWFQGFKGMLDDFSVTTKIRRRIPFIESRLREEERQERDEGRKVYKQAEDTMRSLEDVLRQFLR